MRREIVEVLENKEEKDKEKDEDSRRFVGRMMVSFRGGGEGGSGEGAEDGEAAIRLHNFNQKKYKQRRDEGPADQSGKNVNDVRRNGFKAPLALQRWVLFSPFFHLFEVCC